MVDYKLSPEAKFPVACEEMIAITRLGGQEGSGSGIDPTRLAAGGDLAGGNLALAAALAIRDAAGRDAGERALKFQLLIYGVCSTDTESASWRRFGQGASLSQTQMRWIWQTYLEKPAVVLEEDKGPNHDVLAAAGIRGRGRVDAGSMERPARDGAVGHRVIALEH